MKIGTAAFGEKNLNPSEIVTKFFDNDINIIELAYNDRFTPDELIRIKDFKPDLSIHCPTEGFRFRYSFPGLIIKNNLFCFKSSIARRIEKGFLVAEKLEATDYVLHGGVFPKGYFRFKRIMKKKKLLETFIQTFKPMFLKAKGSNVKIVLENLTKGNIFFGSSDIDYVKDKFDWLGFCLDFGHSELENQTYSLKNLKIDHVHVSDNDLKNDLHLPVGQGNIKFDKLFEILRNQNFKGKLLSECPSIENAIISTKTVKKVLE